ncbi:MAG: chromosomal replication initiator protein DnaA [Betaproteobacteria bacterium]|nr:chromosomal replication initiator protein DnaA [Betaproteobacteria bacterium]MBK9674522.1 chromosomal replication initiator protein DnaA [Betaproteobacteria bacterium]MBK9705157.1 chromosomal replication initiator protein DnaA [Betaproteobacteria bacterium]
MTPLPLFWQRCLDAFRDELTPQQFNTWIRPLAVEAVDGGFRLLAPNRFVLQWVKERFAGRIAELAELTEGQPVDIALAVASAARPAAPPPPATATADSAPPAVAAEAPVAVPATRERFPAAVASPGRRHETSSLNPEFTFASFVSGKANQLARAAAMQVAGQPTSYNPLFVYGGVGLGKTHLIQAIGNDILAREPAARIRYVHAESYVSDVVRAYQHKSFDDFKRYYRSLDLLLIDDIQFFNGKSRTQEEFFYLFNTLLEGHKQVVITCDTYPKEIAGIEERLISRFGWGLTVALEPPELEMRVAILLAKAAATGLKLDEQVAFFLAKHIRSNVRELEGALKRVIAYSSFHGHEITLAVAKEALRDLIAVQNRQVSVENIQKTVADYYKIRISDMHSKKRSRAIARPRQVAMALAKELTQLSLPEIGSNFGGRDHTTVLHACRQIAKLRETVPELNHDVNFLLQVLRS